ncbi:MULTISPECIES: LysR family transcriptional regulator ArgP [Salinicola]|jgi:LysR family transcriptional regulator (chromosome initiation inhibitor)|uniref:LysR family transcriptional regulator ArgP n=1 Tax=Salinicola TaxID=404432 RepID=UPI000B3F9433|nr:LysR family transcriptional regulator ArgP [Salinicola salarius]MDF3919427.1 LysR family transcriptional regulator ArgP [Salinicola salarius]
MLDYKLLEALAAIVDQGGFDRGAQQLNLTQSAVSQRIKLLEARLGQPVVVRTPRLMPTPLGQRLLNHAQQVRLLEHDLLDRIPALGEGKHRLRLALNADSLATWWAPTLGDFCHRRGVLLDLVVDDQEVALRRMRDGEVAGCICATARPVQGARARALGSMRYRVMASPRFADRHFAEGVTHQALELAPAILYGPDDRLHQRYLDFHGFKDPFPHHLCPSSEGVLHMVLAGIGYALIPESQGADGLARGDLVDLDPQRPLDVPLYWHFWRHGGELLDALTAHLVSAGDNWLRAPEASSAAVG